MVLSVRLISVQSSKIHQTPPINNSLNHQEMRTRGSSQVRQKCPRCGSSRWRRDPNRGIITCGEGHLLEGYLQESNTQTEPSQHFTRKRRTVVSTRDRIRKGWVLKDVFEGSRARVLHLEALTFLIRQQVNALINTIRAPRILETITRQLWQAYLTTIPLPSDYQTSDNISLNRSKTSSTDSSSKSIRPRSSLSSSFDDRENDLTEESLRVLTTDQSDEERDQEAFSFIPPEQPQSSSEDEDGDPIVTRQDNSNEPSSLNRLSHQAQTSNSRHYPRIELTICTIYLACLKIRLPITLQDIINMVATKEIPYVGFVHALPDHVKMKMNRSTLCAFNIDRPPRLYHVKPNRGLIYYCRKLAGTFYQLKGPKLLDPSETLPNLSLILLRFSQALLLPDRIQLLSLKMLSRLKTSLICTALQKSEERPKKSPSRRSIYRSNNDPIVAYPPEWIIMATIYCVLQHVIFGGFNPSSSNRLLKRKGLDSWRKVWFEDEEGVETRGSLPCPVSWIDGLNQLDQISIGPNSNPKKLWKKNVSDMNEAEMDSYIDLTERFLLNDGPIPKDIQLRERFFPRITQQQSVQRTFASNHTDNSFPCNFDSYNSLDSISSLYNSSYHDDYSNNLLRTGNSTTVLTESEQIDKRIDRFRSIYQGIKKSLVYEPITEKTVNDLLLSSNSKKSVKDKEENLNGVRKEGDASRRSKMNEGNSVVLETSSLTSLSSSEEDEEKEKTSGCHDRNEEGDNGDEATEEAMERIEREVKEGDDEEQQDEEENSEGNEEESEEGSGSTDDEGGVHLVGYDSELSEGQSESTTMANSDDEIDRDEGRCIDRRKDWIRLSYRIFEKMNEIIGIIDEDSASKNENSVYRKQYDSGRLSFEGLVMVVNLKLFYKIDDLEESGDFEGKASKKRMRENTEGKKKEGDKLLKATDGCIMKDLGDDQTKDIANDSGGVKESQEKSPEKRKNNR